MLTNPGSFALVSALCTFALIVLLAALVWRLHARAERERIALARAEGQVALTNHLQELASALSRARTPAEVIDACVLEFLHALGATAGAVVLVSDDQQASELVRAVGFDTPLAPDARRFPLVEGSALTDAVTRHEIVAVDTPNPKPVSGDAALLRAGDLLTLHRSAVVAPFVTGGRAIGTVVLSFQALRVLTRDEHHFLLTAGRRTADALLRAQAYESAERARVEAEAFRLRADLELRERQKVEGALRESETRYRSLAARTSRLYALSAALSEAITLDAVAKAIVRQGKIVVGASAGSVALLTERGTELETLFADDYERHAVEAWHQYELEEGLCSTAAVRTRRPVFVASFSEWQERYPRSALQAADGGFASGATLPLIVEDRPIGVLAFHFTAPVNFDQEYRAVLVSVAQHCAQAIDRARLYEAAQRARADAEAANRSKDDFLSTLSHELRTPLTAVLGWATMLRKGMLDASKTTRAIEAICNNATRQAEMIEELLDVSRIVAGRAKFDVQELDVAETVRGAVETMMPLAEAKGLTLRLGACTSMQVSADPRRIEQVFLNVIANAIKFTPAGGTISVEMAVPDQAGADAAPGRDVEVRIADTGSGIDPSFLPHVFERFRQGETTTARTAGGLGLGLFIARHLVEAQGGTIRAESAGVGAGATFIVTLPAAETRAARQLPALPPAARSETAAPPATSVAGVRVLVVDDEPDVRELMTAALERSGARVLSAGSTRDALHTLAHVRVDVLLADIAMPGEDGYDLIRAVRRLPAAAANIPAAAVTACARDDERQRALAAGFQLHLPKPIEPAQLVDAVARLARPAAV